MGLNIKKHKIEFFVGIGSSIAATVIISICKYIFDMPISIEPDILRWLDSLVFIRAARINAYSHFLFGLSGVLTFTMAVLITMIVLSIMINNKRHEKTVESRTSDNAESDFVQPATKEFKNEEKEIEKLKKEREYLEQKSRSLREKARLQIMVIISLVLVFVTICLAYYEFIVEPVRTKAQFDIEIQVVAPYVEEQEITKLRSDWVRMRSRADFEKICLKIERIYLENGLGEFAWSDAVGHPNSTIAATP